MVIVSTGPWTHLKGSCKCWEQFYAVYHVESKGNRARSASHSWWLKEGSLCECAHECLCKNMNSTLDHFLMKPTKQELFFNFSNKYVCVFNHTQSFSGKHIKSKPYIWEIWRKPNLNQCNVSTTCDQYFNILIISSPDVTVKLCIVL